MQEDGIINSNHRNGAEKNMGEKNKINYQAMLDRQLIELSQEGKVPSLLLHSCCAPCSSYVLEYLSDYFHITVFYYNPNIAPAEEYEKRIAEQEKLIAELPVKYPIQFLASGYNPEEFYNIAKGYEEEPEGGERCLRCYRLRMEYVAQMAAKGFDYFTTTLSISPLKNAQKINEIGKELSGKYGVKYLYSDFKKKDGYKRSVELSQKYNLYRQNYCGCVYSKRMSLKVTEDKVLEDKVLKDKIQEGKVQEETIQKETIQK